MQLERLGTKLAVSQVSNTWPMLPLSHFGCCACEEEEEEEVEEEEEEEEEEKEEEEEEVMVE